MSRMPGAHTQSTATDRSSHGQNLERYLLANREAGQTSQEALWQSSKEARDHPALAQPSICDLSTEIPCENNGRLEITDFPEEHIEIWDGMGATCGQYPRFRLAAATSLVTECPQMKASPAVGGNSPDASRKHVVFPAPLTPSKPRHSPSRNVNHTPRRACISGLQRPI